MAELTGPRPPSSFDAEKYIELALRTESPPTPALLGRLIAMVRAVHAFFGFTTEIGELADNFKRHIFYGTELDTTNIDEEVGDVFWYLAILLDHCGVKNVVQCMEANIAKLKKRYPEKFDAVAAVQRDLEGERQVLEDRHQPKDGKVIVQYYDEEQGRGIGWWKGNGWYAERKPAGGSDREGPEVRGPFALRRAAEAAFEQGDVWGSIVGSVGQK